MLLFANILSLFGNVFFSVSSLFKKKNKIVIFQSICHVLNSISEFITKAYSGIIQEIISLIRDFILLFIKDDKQTLKLIISIICIIFSVIIGIIFNIIFSNNIWYGYFPILATIFYSIFLVWGYLNKNPILSEMLIKIGLIFNGLFWALYGLFVKLYPTTIFNILTIIFCVISIIRLLKINKKIKKNKLLKNSL